MPESSAQIRRASEADVPAIVQLLAADDLGRVRERDEEPLPTSYLDAFKAIERDPAHELVVVERDGEIVATLQLTVLPYLTYQGGRRGQIEAVRVRADQRGRGIGRDLFAWAIARARACGCHVVQLTTDRGRPGALRFYERLGFRDTHAGMKLHLGDDA